MLYIVPSPIGNLEDITFRAVNVLKTVDLILAEDTRTSVKLLNRYGIKKPVIAYHLHNEHRVTAQLAEEMAGKKTMALLSDAGTPGVSDPGFLLVRECVAKGIKVECLPGATAFVPALVNSGLPMNTFCFEGFIPVKKGRKTYLESMSQEKRTMVFYESPYRLVKTLKDFIEYFGSDRQCSVSRELTKMFEENKRGTLAEVHDYFAAGTVKGEIVIVVAGGS